jgi:SAM-dependent methyltransferase
MTLLNIEINSIKTEHYRGLHIGCANTRIETTFLGNPMLNSDIEMFAETDMLLDVTKPWPFPNAQFEQVVANNIFEHISDLIGVAYEMDRCLQPGGLLNIEVPFIGSYNHGTDVTHKRGLTFDSFNFLLADSRNYLYRVDKSRPFNYKLIRFFRENIIDGKLVHEWFDVVPPRGTYTDWLEKVARFEVPGTFGYIWQKLS